MFNNVSLSTSPLAGSRREASMDRSADAIHGLLEWMPVNSPPSTDGFKATRHAIVPGVRTIRTLFAGGFWMSDAPVAAWRQIDTASTLEQPFKPVSVLHGQLIERDSDNKVQHAKARTFDELSLVPLSETTKSNNEVQALTQLAAMELRVEVVRFLKPDPQSAGITSGRVLAVSENYSAQDIGKNNVVIHDNSALERKVSPGEKVTMSYKAGSASVFDGLAHEINIHAPWMPREQHNYLRMVMLDSISMITEPMDDDARLKSAMRFALESTANFFGLEESRLRVADIKLDLNEIKAPSFAEGAIPAIEPGPAAGLRKPRP